MPVDLHRRRHGADPLATLVPHLDDNIAGIAPGQPALANLSRRAGCPLHGGVQAVELGALIVAHDLCAIQDVKIVAGQGSLLLASTDASDVG